VLADSYQAIGAVDVDVGDLGVDFVTGGTVKYLLGSAGLGFLFVRRGLLDELLPTQTGWFADEDIFQMDISDYSPAADARRFDAGTPPVPNIYGGLAGMSIVDEVGVASIEEHVRGLNTRLIDGLTELGAWVVTPADPARRGPLVCVRSTDVQALVAELAAERIVVSSRDDSVRISAHLYNTVEDVDRVLGALQARRHLLGERRIGTGFLPRRRWRTASIPSRSRTSTCPPPAARSRSSSWYTAASGARGGTARR
jgi:selenocysteine lyase/cysteine desulfurase